jgi:prepilin-type N-terminal cleavage/methylation domain-containing protein
MNNIKNEKGLTLIELMISIMVASMVISMLLSILTMSLKAKATMDVENKLLMESTIISEKLRFNMFELQAQKIELISDDATSTIIHITHEYDILLDGNQIIYKDYSNPIVHILTYDKVTQQITYDSGSGPEILHDNNVLVTYQDELFNVVSSIELISFDDTVCDLAVEPCSEGIIKLTLTITVLFPNGAVLVPQTFITTIII